MDVAISHRFRGPGKKGYVMLPTGYPSNRALFATFSMDSMVDIIATGHLRVGKGVVTFQKWMTKTTLIPLDAVKGSNQEFFGIFRLLVIFLNGK